jgi:hypothetical protein
MANRVDWAFHRSTVKILYRAENKTLKDVMEIMKLEHGLKATYALTQEQ